MNQESVLYKGNFITLRKKPIKNNFSLFLDIYYDGVRKKKYLGLKVTSNKRPTPADKDTIYSAIEYLKKIDMEIINGRFDINTMSLQEPQYIVPFIETYISERTDLLENSKKKYRNTALHIESFLGKDADFLMVKEADLEGFKTYLKTNLSINSADSYFAVLKTVFKEAKRRGLIEKNVSEDIKGVGKKPKLPVYLTEEELQQISRTDCSHKQTKSAFLFSCYTGLRFSDTSRLTYSDIQRDGDKWHLRVSQQKTNLEAIIPLNPKVLPLIMPIGKAEDRVFALWKDDHTRSIIRRWTRGAGISKNVTFHVARHTFATRLITNGADLYTVSKLLGHTDIKHTQIYAQVIDKVKVDAVMSLS